jgi:hypothetical protein
MNTGEVIALIKAFGGGGGGSSGGGVLVVHLTQNEATFTMDKTYSEIKSADVVLVKFFNSLCPVLEIADSSKQHDNTVSVAVCSKDGENVQWNPVDFTTVEASGYPSHTFE